MKLSPRQEQIMTLAAQGYTQKEIAAQLGISYQTVKNYLTNAYTRLGIAEGTRYSCLIRAMWVLGYIHLSKGK